MYEIFAVLLCVVAHVLQSEKVQESWNSGGIAYVWIITNNFLKIGLSLVDQPFFRHFRGLKRQLPY